MLLKIKSTTLEYQRVGSGPLIILFHSTASSLNQWHSLINLLKNEYEIIAINLFGYGLTSKWIENNNPQNLLDHVKLTEPFINSYKGKITFIGHSFGGSVAMRAGLEYQNKLEKLILLEPNAFFILDKKIDTYAYNIENSFGNKIIDAKNNSSWGDFARIFLEFWIGQGTWEKMNSQQQQKFLNVIPNIYYEAQSIFNEKMKLNDFINLQKKSILLMLKILTLYRKKLKKYLFQNYQTLRILN